MHIRGAALTPTGEDLDVLRQVRSRHHAGLTLCLGASRGSGATIMVAVESERRAIRISPVGEAARARDQQPARPPPAQRA